MKNKEKLMSAYEVAELLHVSHTTVYKWVKDGLKGKIEKKFGVRRRMVFTEKDLLTYFKVKTLDELISKSME